jgi:hypothetical protein
MPISVGRRSNPEEPVSGTRYRRGSTEETAFSNGAAEARGESPRGRRGRSDAPADEPRSRNGSRGSNDSVPKREPRRGWSGSKKTREESSDYADRFKLPEDDYTLIIFLEDEPFDSANRHFIREIQGQKSFICPGKNGPYRCALDAAGDKAMPIDYFNIAILEEGQDPVAKVWECGPGYSTEINNKQNSRAVGGKLSNVYFEVKGIKAPSGKGATKLDMNVVRERDLENEWGVQPLSDEELAVLEKQMKSDGYVQYSSEKSLKEAADKLLDLSD